MEAARALTEPTAHPSEVAPRRQHRVLRNVPTLTASAADLSARSAAKCGIERTAHWSTAEGQERVPAGANYEGVTGGNPQLQQDVR